MLVLIGRRCKNGRGEGVGVGKCSGGAHWILSQWRRCVRVGAQRFFVPRDKARHYGELLSGHPKKDAPTGGPSRDRAMYSETVLEHFRNPRNVGKLEGATAEVRATNPVCGDILELAARVHEGRIVEAKFLCRGCTTSIACGSWLTEWMTGKGVVEVRALTSEQIAEALQGLPPASFHGAQLAAEAAGMLMKKVGDGI
jgi:nitrogen fixation protein NifU and related proteins